MKKSNLIYLLVLPFIFSSCDDFFGKFDHFGVGNTFEESFSVSVNANDQTSYAGSVSFDASDDATLDENIDKISQFEVNRISVVITSFTGDPSTIASGSFTITSEGQPVGTPVSLDLNLNSEEEVVLPFTDATFRAIKDAYLEKQKITITAEGSVSSAPIEVEFTVYMTIEATIDN
jgi:hypothetical protein